MFFPPTSSSNLFKSLYIFQRASRKINCPQKMYPLLGTFSDNDIHIFDNMPFKKIRRNLKNFAYSDVEKKVRQATNNDPWGPSSLLMSEIAEATKDQISFQQIIHLLWERLEEEYRQWRHIFKALYLLEYLIKAGDEKVRKACMNNVYRFNRLRQFKYIDGEYDRGKTIQEKAESIVSLLLDKEALEKERQKIENTRTRCIGESSNMGYSTTTSSSTTTYCAPKKKKKWREELQKRKNVEKAIEATEKFGAENALQLALALSEREMEEAEHVVGQDEEMLKMAIEESKRLATAAETPIELPERPFSPPPTSLFQKQQQSAPKVNVIDEIANDIMALDLYQPSTSPAPLQRLPSFNNSFYKLACTPTLSSPSLKNLPDLATPTANPFEVVPSNLFQTSVITPSIASALSQHLPELSPYSFDPFADASARALQEEIDAALRSESTAAPVLNPFKVNSSNNTTADDRWNLGFVSPRRTCNDPWSSTQAPYFDIFNNNQKRDTVVPDNQQCFSTPTPNSDIFIQRGTVAPIDLCSSSQPSNFDFLSSNQQHQYHTVFSSARGCTSSEAYQKMEKAFRSFKVSSTSSSTQNGFASAFSPQAQPPSINPFLNDLSSNNGLHQYPHNNPFIKDLLS